jgi:hypothetical protein
MILRLPGGKQRIVVDGYQIPLTFRNGLAYLKCWPPTDAEVDSLPHLIMTADVDGDPTSYDNLILDLHKIYDQDIDDVPHAIFDAHENYLHRTVATHLVQPESEFFDVHELLTFDDIIDDIVDSLNPSLVEYIYLVNNLDVRNSPQDYNLLCPFFAWAPADTIQKTIGVTTQ